MGRALGFNGPYGLTDSKFKGSMARAVSRTRSSVSVFEVIGLKCKQVNQLRAKSSPACL